MNTVPLPLGSMKIYSAGRKLIYIYINDYLNDFLTTMYMTVCTRNNDKWTDMWTTAVIN